MEKERIKELATLVLNYYTVVFKGAKLRKVDGIKIKADTYYSLINGKFTEVSQ